MLVLVVGPSGAGKDTVLGLARQALAADKRFRFVQRVITRPADAGNEDHQAVSEAEFALRAFALRWQAHGLHYGIPLDVLEDLRRGIVVVANVSRTVIAEAAGRFASCVIEVTAPPETLARRLTERGREKGGEVAQRMARDVSIPENIPVDTIINDGTPAQAADDFIAVLIRAASHAPPG